MKTTSTLTIIFLTCLLLGFTPADQSLKNATSGEVAGHRINAIHITEEGLCYFATDNGLATYDGTTWTALDQNPKITTGIINDLDFELTTYGPELWLGTNAGVNVISLPVDATSGATTYTKENTDVIFPEDPNLAGNEITAVSVDNNKTRWYGTTEGLSAFRGQNWPTIEPGPKYSADFFTQYPVTSIDYSNDTAYIGTMGGGVARMVAPADVDVISGASIYEIPWSNILSQNILSVFVDGQSQWYGSDAGVVKHIGTEAKENWTTYEVNDGLVNNTVQCITKDNDGNMWFGTQGGVSKLEGSAFVSYTTAEGLIDNNVLSMAVDANNTVWIGTANGLSYIDGSTVTSINNVKLATNDLRVYPNPAQNQIAIKLPQGVSQGELRIINTNGSIVKTKTNYQGEELNISALTPGIYFIQFNYGNKTSAEVLVKK